MRRRLVGLFAAVAWVGVIAGIYLAFFAAGAQIWSFAVLAAASLLVGGLLKLAEPWVKHSETRVWAFGTVEVIEVSAPPQGELFGRCEMRVITEAAGLRRREVVVRDPRAPVDSWPEVGATLPAQISIPDANVRVQWERVASSASR